MKDYSLVERAQFYTKAFPTYPPLFADGRWLSGVWLLGNNYKGNGFYGAYPPGYLKRVNALFPDAEKALHLFSGSLPQGNYVRFDCNVLLTPDVVGEAEKLSQHFARESFDFILADPPYSAEDAKRYGTVMINRSKILRECWSVLRNDGYLGWLDTMLPMFRKTEWHLCGLICVVRSTNHRVRLLSLFKKVG